MAVWEPGAPVWAVSQGRVDTEEDDARPAGIDAGSGKRELR